MLPALKSKSVESDRVSFSLLSTNLKTTAQIHTLSPVTFQEWETELIDIYENKPHNNEELKIRRPPLMVIRNNLKYIFLMLDNF